MTRKRIEPVLGESSERQASPEPLVLEPSRDSRWSELPPVIRLASLAIVVACSIFVADWVYQRYVEYRAALALKAIVEQAGAGVAAMDRQAEARQAYQRQARASSAQGRWMHRNCEDWRRSYGDRRLPTAREEMRRHCQAYERYLETGQVAAEFRVPVQ